MTRFDSGLFLSVPGASAMKIVRSSTELIVHRVVRRLPLFFWVAAVMMTPLRSAQAQCDPGWLPPTELPGVDGSVYAVANWDPDGPGPLPALIVVGGDFENAGNVAARNIAAWNPVLGEWSALGAGTSGPVRALAGLADGSLVAGGDFVSAGGQSASRIARWNGTAWSALGSGLEDGDEFVLTSVHALAVMPGGDLVAAGNFNIAGGVTAHGIARWNGAAWSALADGVGGNYPYVYTLKVLSNGELVAGGDFTVAGSVVAGGIARWNGTAWLSMDADLFGFVSALSLLPSGELVAAGGATVGMGVGVGRVARWNGATWTKLGADFDSSVRALAVLATGELVAGGWFSTADGDSAAHIARWTGTNWIQLSSGVNGLVHALEVQPGGNLLVGGSFSEAGGVFAKNVARFTGSAWSPLLTTLNAPVNVLKVLPDGGLIAGGTFTAAPGGVIANRIARLDGDVWSPLGSGMGLGSGTTYGAVYSIAVEPDGAIVAGGYFVAAGSVTANNVARWNGSAWSAMVSGSGCCGTGMNHNVFALALQPSVHAVAQPHGYYVVLGGSFWSMGRIARWSGTDWYGVPIPTGVSDAVVALEPHPMGGFIAGGYFTSTNSGSANRIARFDNEVWSPLGSGMNDVVYTVAVMANGDVIAGGLFTTAGGVSASRIARWNGTTWSPLGTGMNGPVIELVVLPGGDVVAGGTFTTAGGVSANNIARWDGTAWTALGSGVDNYVHALAVLPNGDLAVGGNFTMAGNQFSPYFARYRFSGTAPVFSVQPLDADACTGGAATFAVAAAGAAPLSYQWRADLVPIDVNLNPSAATATLTIDNVQALNAGGIDCVVTGACGEATSDSALLAVFIGGSGDGDSSGAADGADVAGFVNAFLQAGPPSAAYCAFDMDQDGVVALEDMPLFVAALTSS